MSDHGISRMSPFLKTILAVSMVLGLAGCEGSSAPESGKPVIVASIWPLAAVAGELVGDSAEVVCLVPPGQSPHGFEMTGRQVKAVARARWVVAVGMGFDGWVDRSVRQHGRKDAVFLRMADAAGLKTEEKAHDHSHHDHGHDHEHGPNAHLWLDPVFMMRTMEQLEKSLIDKLPQAADGIRQRAAALRSELEAVDREYAEALEKHKGAKIVTFHNAFDLLLEHYSLGVAATLMPDDTPGALTPARLQAARKVIQDHGVKAVYAEPQFMEVGRRLAEETGLKVLVLDPIGDPASPDRAGYPALLRYNLKVLLEGLSLQAADR